MAAFRINRTNDAVFKAVFAKHPEITLALINAFFEFQGTELLTDIEFIDRELDADECEGNKAAPRCLSLGAALFLSDMGRLQIIFAFSLSKSVFCSHGVGFGRGSFAAEILLYLLQGASFGFRNILVGKEQP